MAHYGSKALLLGGRYCCRSSRFYQRIYHLNRSIARCCRQMLGVEDGCAGALGGLKDQGIPKGNLVAYYDLQRFLDRCGSVGNHLPGGVIANQWTDFLDGQGIAGVAAEMNAQLFKNLRAQHTPSGGPKLLQQHLRAQMLDAGGAVMRIDQNVGINKALTAHAVLPVSGLASSASQSPTAAVIRHCGAPGRILCAG